MFLQVLRQEIKHWDPKLPLGDLKHEIQGPQAYGLSLGCDLGLGLFLVQGRGPGLGFGIGLGLGLGLGRT